MFIIMRLEHYSLLEPCLLLSNFRLLLSDVEARARTECPA
jgi:hypothetical protein